MPVKFPPEARERLKVAVRDRVLPRFGPDPQRAQSAAARALGVSQSMLSRLLAEPSSGGSLQVAEKVARYLNETPSSLLLGEDAPAIRQLRELPGFAEAMAEAARRAELEHPGITQEDLEIAADTRATPEPARVTAGLLIHIALARQTPHDSTLQHKRARRRT